MNKEQMAISVVDKQENDVDTAHIKLDVQSEETLFPTGTCLRGKTKMVW
jgi:hypothetical protein